MKQPWNFIAHSRARGQALDLAQRAATADCPVLIMGPTGTGKDVLAEDIHNHSARAAQRFVAVNCAALTSPLFESELFGHSRGAYTGAISSKRGLVEVASGGSLFLDEVGELPIEAQAKLLRFLAKGTYWPLGATEERSSDVRMIAATNRDLVTMLDGSFREDLFFRLSVLTIVVPPLDRDDASALTRVFALEIAGKRRLAVGAHEIDALAELLSPGSLRGGARELRNSVERYLLVRDPGRSVRENWRAAALLDPIGQHGRAQPGVDLGAADYQVVTRQIDDLLFLLSAREAGSARALSRVTNRSLQYVYARLSKLGIKASQLKTAVIDQAISRARASLLPHRSTLHRLLDLKEASAP